MLTINKGNAFGALEATSALRAEAIRFPSVDMLGVTYQLPPSVCNFNVLSPMVTARLSGKYPINKVAPDKRGRLSVFASTDAIDHGRISAAKITAAGAHFFIICLPPFLFVNAL